MKSQADCHIEDSIKLLRCAAELIETAEELADKAYCHLREGGSLAHKKRLGKATDRYREVLAVADVEAAGLGQRFPKLILRMAQKESARATA